MKIKEIADNIKKEYKSGKAGKQRVLIVAVSLVFVMDYMMFSYHTASSVFDIFPSIPALDNKKIVDIYIPSEGAEKIISEKREVNPELSGENLAKKFFALVAKGSFYDNTSSNVPVKLTVKKVWITDDESGQGKVCLIDVMPVTLEKDSVVVKGSEKMFKDALEKTITSNMPDIKRVLILEKGVPLRKLWEI